MTVLMYLQTVICLDIVGIGLQYDIINKTELMPPYVYAIPHLGIKSIALKTLSADSSGD